MSRKLSTSCLTKILLFDHSVTETFALNVFVVRRHPHYFLFLEIAI